MRYFFINPYRIITKIEYLPIKTDIIHNTKYLLNFIRLVEKEQRLSFTNPHRTTNMKHC